MTRTKEKKASRERRFCLQRMFVAFVVNSYFWPGVWTDRTFEWNGIPVNVTDKGEYVVDTDAVFTSLKDDAMVINDKTRIVARGGLQIRKFLNHYIHIQRVMKLRGDVRL